jgi:peptidoglycan/xylan/chitin deacetylase (PgdA/CDA1 family)
MLGEISIFLFHRVSGDKKNWTHATHVSIFEKCISYITRNYTVKTIEECLSAKGSIKPKKGKPLACITFDDGFKDNVTYALPILEKYKCPASFYMITGCIDKGLPTWPHLYNNVFENTRKMKLVIDSEELGIKVDESFRSAEERIAYGIDLVKKIRFITPSEADNVLGIIKQSFDDVQDPQHMMMTWNEVQQIYKAGYAVGSHTYSHPMLSLIKDDNRLTYEMVHSGERIKEVCGSFPETIAYPFGLTDERVMKIAKEAGYKNGLIVGQRRYKPGYDTNLMGIPRIDIYAEASWLKTYLRITGGIEAIKKIVGR